MITELFIDRLALTIAIKPSEHGDVKNRLDVLALQGSIRKEENRHSELFKSFRYAYHIEFGPTCSCIIQISPYKPNNRFMRMEWNPNNARTACADPMMRIVNTLSESVPSYAPDLILNANITRIDLSFDLLRIPLESIVVFGILRKSCSGRYLQSHETFRPNGTVNALEIGKKDSDCYLLVYDKEIEEKNRLSEGNMVSSSLSGSQTRVRKVRAHKTRFELRLRSVGTWENLFNAENPFHRYTVRSMVNIGNVRNDHQWQFFVDSCRRRGAQAALSLIKTQRERDRYRSSLREVNPPTWWNPDAIWRGLSQAVRTTLGVAFETVLNPEP